MVFPVTFDPNVGFFFSQPHRIVELGS